MYIVYFEPTFLEMILEKKLKEYFEKYDFLNIQSFQKLRLFMSLGSYTFMCFLVTNSIFLPFSIGFIVYFIFYILILLNVEKKRKEAQIQFPYFLKIVDLLMQTMPVINALHTSIEYTPEVFLKPLKKLVKDLHGQPHSELPYIEFTQQFPNIKELRRITRILYRLNNADWKEKNLLFHSMTTIVNEQVKSTRKQKNQTINQRITWIGMIPVILLSLIFISIMVSGLTL